MDTVQVTVQLDGAALAAARAPRLHHDLVDERADDLPGVRAVVRCRCASNSAIACVYRLS